MAENLLSDVKVRTATLASDGAYLRDGGGLRIRLKPPSGKYRKGARLAEYHFKLKAPDGAYRNAALHLGTIGDPFTAGAGVTRAFTLADARAARNAARALVAKGIDPRQAGRLARLEKAEAMRDRIAELESRRTVRQAFEKWQALYLSAHHKDGGAFVADLFGRHVLPTIGDRPLETIRKADAIDLLDNLTAAGTRRTANMALSNLRQFFRWCMARDWCEIDPTALLRKADAGGKESSRDRTLSAMEIVELRDKLPKLPDRIQAALWLILATGARVGELAAARREHFDLEASQWHLPMTKNGEPHLIHLSPFALQKAGALLDLAKPSDWLLPGRAPERPASDKIITKMVGDRQREAPLKGRSKDSGALVLARGKWTPHDLRRTMASRMQDLGIRPDVIERCLNHKPEGIAAVYQRAELLPERKAAFKAWGAELERLQALRINVAQLPARHRAKAAA